jgi:hypothetical protein
VRYWLFQTAAETSLGDRDVIACDSSRTEFGNESNSKGE